MLEHLIDDTRGAFDRALEAGPPDIGPEETGRIVEVGGGIARVSGLPRITAEELVSLPGGLTGLAINLDPHEVGVADRKSVV